MPRHTAPDFVLRGATCNGKTGNFRLTRNPFLRTLNPFIRTLNPFIRTLKLPPDPSELSTGADGCMTRMPCGPLQSLRRAFCFAMKTHVSSLHNAGSAALIRLLVPFIRSLNPFTRTLHPFP